MKKLSVIAIAVALLVNIQAGAQSSNAYKLDAPEVSAADPYTTLRVTVMVEKETIKKGPYARFAQKYLGVVAPLNDKDIYTIKSANISYAANGEQTPGSAIRSGLNISNSSPKVSVDRLDFAEKGSEDMARDAANMIFNIRKRRFDLVSGEAGENVFGEGLKAALQELNRLENEYTALFLGSQTVERETRTFNVIPQAGRTNYIVCRFKADGGFVPESDLSGTPIVLVLNPENGIQVPPVGKGARASEYFRVADFVQCTLSGPSGEIATARIPIYQFGKTIAAQAAAK